MSVCGHQHVLKPKWPILGVQMPSIISLFDDKSRIIKWGLSLVMLFAFALSFTYYLLFFCFQISLSPSNLCLTLVQCDSITSPSHTSQLNFFSFHLNHMFHTTPTPFAFPLATLFCNFLLTYNMFIKKSEHFILCT